MTDASDIGTARPVHPWVAAAAHGPRFGLAVAPQHLPQCVEMAQLAEQLGFDSYWLNDHPTRAADPWSALAAVAVKTERIRLGSLVSCIYYRSPQMLARLATDVDRLSQGRLVLGLGLGDDEDEFAQLGLVLLPVRERLAALEETLTMVQGMWHGDAVSMHGTYARGIEARLKGALPVQQPWVPILIGGGGERRTLRQVAALGDMANFGEHAWIGGATTLDLVARKLQALRDHCAALGRPYESVLRSHTGQFIILAETPGTVRRKADPILARLPAVLQECSIACTPAELADRYLSMVRLGMQYFIAIPYGDDVETIRLLSDAVMPEVRRSAAQLLDEEADPGEPGRGGEDEG